VKTTIITTIDHNVGDDFVREGILYLLRQRFDGFSQSFIHKHIPITVRPEWEWYYLSGLSRQMDRLPRAKGLFWSRIIDRLPINPDTDKILTADLLVQSGAPVYWKGAHTNEWFEPLIRKRYCSITRSVPFLNIGAGTCLPYHSDGSEILSDPNCTAYIKELHALSTVTTLRDTLSHSILNQLGLDAPVLPCPSIFARDNLKVDPKEPEFVALNFMPLGGHFGLGQDIDSSRWTRVYSDFARQIAKRNRVVLVCHDAGECEAASRAMPDISRVIATSAQKYLDIYSRARYYVGCRVHAAYATASFGRPAFIIGSDTRARMSEIIGLKNIYVNDATAAVLMAQAEEMENSWKQYRDMFQDIRQKTLAGYTELLQNVRLTGNFPP
jgi:polysaccharide pyruvyl transferase